MKRISIQSPMIIIFITVFIYLVGFGVVIPLTPFLARKFGAADWEIGLLMSIYSLMQFIFAPLWGRMSDRIGRRPVLLVCLFAEGVTYLIFAFGTSLWTLFVARALAGIFAASISTASAYVSDITPPEGRAKAMGVIGAAFGLGFVVGPVLGGALGVWGQRLGSEPPWGMSYPALWVAALCFITVVFAWTKLKESLQKENRDTNSSQDSRFHQICKHLKHPVVGALMLALLLGSLAMSNMEATLFLYMNDSFGWGMEKASLGFAYIGLTLVFTQGFFIRKAVAWWGERRVLLYGFTCLALGLTLIGYSFSFGVLITALTLLAVGHGLVNPSLLGSISLLSDPKEQGVVMGVAQSLSAIARIVGPIMGALVYDGLTHSAPFWLGGAVVAVALSIILKYYWQLPQIGKRG